MGPAGNLLWDAIEAIEGLMIQLSQEADRIAFLERWAKLSRTGVTIEWSPEEGYRVMTFHKIDVGQRNVRDAIDAAIAFFSAPQECSQSAKSQ